MKFDFDENKAQENLKKHGVSFAEAAEAFSDPNAVEFFDELNSGLEFRFQIIALSPVRLLFVAYTIREDLEEVIRLISARRADKSEEKIYNEYNK